MEKPVLLIQFRTDQSRSHEVEQIKESCDFKDGDVKVINVLDRRYKIPSPRDLDQYSGIITGASGQFNVTDWPNKIKKRVEKLLPFFREIIARDFPTLAICFGHQLLAHLFGGRVESDPTQHEVGTLEIKLTREGKNSPLFRGIPEHFFAVLGHKDSVAKLPDEATLLASSASCSIEAYRIKRNIYTVQFHPELDLDGLLWRLSLYPEYLKRQTLAQIRKQYHEIKHPRKILTNFQELIVYHQ